MRNRTGENETRRGSPSGSRDGLESEHRHVVGKNERSQPRTHRQNWDERRFEECIRHLQPTLTPHSWTTITPGRETGAVPFLVALVKRHLATYHTDTTKAHLGLRRLRRLERTEFHRNTGRVVPGVDDEGRRPRPSLLSLGHPYALEAGSWWRKELYACGHNMAMRKTLFLQATTVDVRITSKQVRSTNIFGQLIDWTAPLPLPSINQPIRSFYFHSTYCNNGKVHCGTVAIREAALHSRRGLLVGWRGVSCPSACGASPQASLDTQALRQQQNALLTRVSVAV